MTNMVTIGGCEIVGPLNAGYEAVLTEEAMSLVAELARAFRPRVQAALQAREDRQARYNAGELPDFSPETKNVRDGDWTVRGVPADLLDRRVEITGPVDRKMVINALNTPVQCYMADFEDSQSPTWEGVVEGQINLKDAVAGTITYDAPNGKHYELRDDRSATLICRVRGWHLEEKHILVDGEVIPGALFDFALYFVHNHKNLIENNTGAYFYLPKMEHSSEAKIWADAMDLAEDKYGLERGTVKATALIETIPAVFQMHEILWEMRDHMVALNCGRWDYIFSYIKTLREHADRVLPDRHSVGMNQHFLNKYSQLLIRTCHQRGALAMGGMAAFIPLKDAEANKAVTEKVIADKTFEGENGHDGTWIAHPGLAGIALPVMNKYMPEGQTNQLSKTRADDAEVTQEDLLRPCDGPKTEEGLRKNIRIAVFYIEAWISGNGCVPIYGLMEDAATAEISRAMIWQWIRHNQTLDDGQPVTAELFRKLMQEELDGTMKTEVGDDRFNSGRFTEAAKIMDEMTTGEFATFLTLRGYEYLD